MKVERILSVIFAVLFPLPLMITSAAGGGSLDFARLAFYAGLGLGAWTLSALFGLLLKKTPEKIYALIKFLSIFLGAVTVAICAWIIIMAGDNSASIMFMPVAMALCWWFGYKLGSDREVLPFGAMGGYCVEAVFVYPMCCAMEENSGSSLGSSLILIITAALIVMGAVIFNLRHLEQLSYQGGGKELALSKATVRFNLKKTLTFSGVLLFLFLFSGFWAAWLWEAVKAFIIWLLEMLKRLAESFDIDPLEPEFERPEIDIPNNENLLVRIIFFLIVAAIIIVGAILLVRYIKRLIASVRKYLKTKAETKSVEAGYVDIYEESERQQKKSTYSRVYRAFLREKDPAKKYRLGYKAFMLLLGRKNENAPSDTTGVHLVRGRIYDGILAENVVSKYEQLRYHQYSPTKEDCEELDRLLKAVHFSR